MSTAIPIVDAAYSLGLLVFWTGTLIALCRGTITSTLWVEGKMIHAGLFCSGIAATVGFILRHVAIH